MSKGGTAFIRGETFVDHTNTIKLWVEAYDPPYVIVHRFTKSNIVVTDWMKSEIGNFSKFKLIKEPNIYRVPDGHLISTLLIMNPGKRDEWGLNKRKATIDDTIHPHN